MTCNTSWFRGAPAPGALISNLRQHREVPMRRKHFARSLLGSFTIAAGLLSPLAADAEVGDFRRACAVLRTTFRLTVRLG